MLRPRRSRLSRRLPVDGPPVTCELCRYKGLRKEFRLRPGGLINSFCNSCWRADRKKVLTWLRSRGQVFRRDKHQQFTVEFLKELARRRMYKRKEVMIMRPEEYAAKVAKLPERIAAIISKTYAVEGDAADMADDEAMMRIRDLLLEIDPQLIEKNKNKRLARGQRC